MLKRGGAGMARRPTRYERRRNTLLAWWACIAILCVLAWRVGVAQLWLLPLIAWIPYELCYAPTTCGVQTTRGQPCKNPTSGRLYACKEQPAHAPLKRDALFRLLGLRHGPALSRTGQAPSSQTAHAEYALPESATIDPHQKVMLYLTVIATLAGVIQTIWAVKGSI